MTNNKHPQSPDELISFLRAKLDYDPETGVLTWKNSKINRSHVAGKAAGWVCPHKLHRRIQIAGVFYGAHRIAWAIYHGSFPKECIDHINGVRDDNRISNLRECTWQENAKNSKRPRRNTSGESGIYWIHKIKKWCARISIDGKQTHLGVFSEKEDAKAAWSRAKLENGYSERHGME